jgi:hypothetical protein
MCLLSRTLIGVLSQPSLPSEVWGVVAEVLAGDCALRTLANVNVINHDIHEETLPVLYETVFLDRWKVDDTLLDHFRHRDKAVPGGYRFTR